MKNIQFINPDGSNKKQVERSFHNSLKLLLDFLSNANEHALLPKEVNWDNIDFKLPKKPHSESKMEQELEKILSLSMNPANTSYIGHMDSIPSAYSIIGNLYVSALNNNMFSLEMSPYFTRIEYALVKQFSNLFGLPQSSSGVIVSGGTLSNIQAIITARNFHLKSNTGDISKSKKPLVFSLRNIRT